MLTKEQEKRIESLYAEYQEDIKPLTFYVERKYHRFPKALLKEFRDVFDHISRCYERDASEQYIEENIGKAKNHFDRIKLDTYKYVSDYKKREFSGWKKKYNNILGVIASIIATCIYEFFSNLEMPGVVACLRIFLF